MNFCLSIGRDLPIYIMCFSASPSLHLTTNISDSDEFNYNDECILGSLLLATITVFHFSTNQGKIHKKYVVRITFYLLK